MKACAEMCQCTTHRTQQYIKQLRKRTQEMKHAILRKWEDRFAVPAKAEWIRALTAAYVHKWMN